MKRFFSVVLFAITLALLVGLLSVGVYAIYSIKTEYDMLVDSGASGHEFLGLIGMGWLYGGILFAASIVGAIFAGISEKMLVWKIPKKISSVSKMLFRLICFGTVLMFFSGAIL